jgi:hypothetical protein
MYAQIQTAAGGGTPSYLRAVRCTAGSFSLCSCDTRIRSSQRALCSGGDIDKQARKERIEKMILREEALHSFETLPLPERFRKLAEWAATHLSATDQEWLYQQWQQVLERYLEEPPDDAAPSVEQGPLHTRGTP